jgi:excisionase family DNA binding protein
MPAEPNVLPSAEVARRKGVSRQAVSAAAQRGTLNAVKMGTVLLIRRDGKLDAYLATVPQPGQATA